MNILKIIEKLKEFNPNMDWSLPPDLEFGILTTNHAFIEAKKQRANPRELAEKMALDLQDFLNKDNLELKTTTVGAYINIEIEPNLYNQILAQTINPDNLLEKINKKVLIDFCSINVAKPLHAGHLRNIDIGESLKRILSLKFESVKTENYWGDWGVQFGIMLWAWKIFLQKKALKVIINGESETINFEDYQKDSINTLVKLYIWGNQQKDSVENWEGLVRDEFLQLEQGNEQNRQIWQSFLDSTKEQIYPYLLELGVKRHDFEFGESYYESRMKELTSFFEENNIWEKEEKARYFDFEKLVENWEGLDEKLKPKIKRLGRCYLISSQGYTSYAYRDIAARIHWTGELDMDLMITITGNEQIHHFAQFFAICYYLSSLKVFQNKFSPKVIKRLNYEHLVHISYGFLTLPTGKMSTRKGNFLTAQDLMNSIFDEAKKVLSQKGGQFSSETIKKVGIAAIKWFDLNRDSKLDVVLNLDQILQFEGNTGVYQLYTIARLNSILEKNPINKNLKLENVENLLNNQEKMILKQTLTLPLLLDQISTNYKPHLLCNHLFEIANQTNSWYAKHSVSNETDQNRKQALLQLIQKIKNHLWFGLDLLGVEGVERL
jgi:arginyl-tRNA synthetase